MVDYIKLSPNRTSPRNAKIDTITIHCVVGQVTVETLGNIFFPTSRQASSNYGIGLDGRIGMYVEEKNRSWCTSSALNDNRAITIEVASDTTPPYAVNDKAYESLIRLLVDICSRNGIKELRWKGDKSLVGKTDVQNMTVHRWFSATECPGEYLYSRHKAIADEVNKRLGELSGETQKAPTKPQNEPQILYKVQCGSFSNIANATKLVGKLKDKGFDAFIVQAGRFWRVQIGAFSKKENAEALLKKVQESGHKDAMITHIDQSIKTEPTNDLFPGDKVKVVNPIDYNGKKFKLYYSKYTVFEVKGDRVVIGVGSTITAAVHKDNLTKVY